MTCKGGGVEVNADKNQYIFLYWDQNAGRCRIVKIDNSSLNIVEVFKYFVKNSTKENFIKEEIKSILNSGNACYRSMQNVLSPVCYSKIERLAYTHV